MITLIKVNVLTDDEELPSSLKQRLEKVLQEYVDDDTEGVGHAKMHFAWKHTIFPRSYMESVPKPNSVRIGPSTTPQRPRAATAKKRGR